MQRLLEQYLAHFKHYINVSSYYYVVSFSYKFSYCFTCVHNVCLLKYYLLEDWNHIFSIFDNSPMVFNIHSVSKYKPTVHILLFRIKKET